MPPSKRIQNDIPSVKDSWQPLSEEDLQTHNGLTRSTAPYDMDIFSIETPERKDHKRSASRQSSVSEMIIESTTISQRSSGSAASYRWRILSEVGISVSSKPLPEAIRLQTNEIFGREISNGRRGELQYVAKQLCDDFVQALTGASHIDNCVAPIKHALLSMDSCKNFGFPRNIGIAFLSHVSTWLILLTSFRLGSTAQAQCPAGTLGL